MNAEDFKQRTSEFALQVIRLVQALPRYGPASIAGKQLLRSATSVGANYRSACCGKSRADFIAKLAIVCEECDESLYWMELLLRSGQVRPAAVEEIMKEARQILALTVASLRTARSRRQT